MFFDVIKICEGKILTGFRKCTFKFSFLFSVDYLVMLVIKVFSTYLT